MLSLHRAREIYRVESEHSLGHPVNVARCSFVCFSNWYRNSRVVRTCNAGNEHISRCNCYARFFRV